MQPVKNSQDIVNDITNSYQAIYQERDNANALRWDKDQAKQIGRFREPISTLVRIIHRIFFFKDFAPKGEVAKPINLVIGNVETAMNKSLEAVNTAKKKLAEHAITVKKKGEGSDKIQESVIDSLNLCSGLYDANRSKSNIVQPTLEALGRKLEKTCFLDDSHYLNLKTTSKRIDSVYSQILGMTETIVETRIAQLKSEIREEMFQLFQADAGEVQAVQERVGSKFSDLHQILQMLVARGNKLTEREKTNKTDLDLYLNELGPLTESIKDADELTRLKSTLQQIFGDLNSAVRTQEDKKSTAYLGSNAIEPAISLLRKISIGFLDVLGKVFPFAGIERALTFSQAYLNETIGPRTHVTHFGGYNIKDTQFDVAVALCNVPATFSTDFLLWQGDTTANMEELSMQTRLRGRKAGASIAANDSRLFGTADVSSGSQEEAVVRQSNLYAKANYIQHLRGNHAHHIPTMGTVYVKNAKLMANNVEGKVTVDLSMVSALDLRPGSDDRVAAEAAAVHAGMSFDDFVYQVTRIKYAALLSSFLQNGVTDPLISLPGIGEYQNDVHMIRRVLEDLLFKPDAPFAGRFYRVIFNVKDGAQKAGLADNETVAMLHTLGVNPERFLGKDPVIEKLTPVSFEAVLGIADSGSVFFNRAGETSFLGNTYPVRFEMDSQPYSSLEQALATQRLIGAMSSAANDKERARAAALAIDPLFLELKDPRTTPTRAKRLGELLAGKYTDIDAKFWTAEEEHKQMWKILNFKFRVPEMRAGLKATRDARLQAHSPEWENSSYWYDGHTGEGHNMLGRMLMAIRDSQECPAFEAKVDNAEVVKNKKSYDVYVKDQRLPENSPRNYMVY